MTSIQSELFSVKGKTALVTGGARGIGLLIVQALVEAGATVYLTSRSPDAAEQVAAELSLLGECHPLPADLSSEGGCRALADEFISRGDQLHLLVNNAGTLHVAPLEEFDDAAWDTVLQVNLKAVFHLTKFLRTALNDAAGPDDPARILNIGSVDGLHVPPVETYSYAASKAAVHHLTRHLAKRLAPRITVNAIALGPFESEMMEPDLATEIGRHTPMRRHGRLEDIAGIIQFLGSRASAYLTGAIIPVDGGIATTR